MQRLQGGQRVPRQVEDWSPGICSEFLEGWFESVPDRFDSAGSILRKLLLRRSRQVVRRANRRKTRLKLRGRSDDRQFEPSTSAKSKEIDVWKTVYGFDDKPGFFQRWAYTATDLCEGWWQEENMESSSSSYDSGAWQCSEWQSGPTYSRATVKLGRWARFQRRRMARKCFVRKAGDWDTLEEIVEEYAEEEHIERWIWFRVNVGQSLFEVRDGTENAILNFGEALSFVAGGAAVGYAECVTDLNLELVGFSVDAGGSLAQVVCWINRVISPSLTAASSSIAEYSSEVSYAICKPFLNLHLKASMLGAYVNYQLTPYVIRISSSVIPLVASPIMMATEVSVYVGKVLQPLAASTHAMVSPVSLTLKAAWAPISTRLESILVPCMIVAATPFISVIAVIHGTLQPYHRHVAAAISPLTSQIEAYSMILKANLNASLAPVWAPDDPAAQLSASWHALWAPWWAAAHGFVQPWNLQAQAALSPFRSTWFVVTTPAVWQINAALAPIAADMNAAVSPLLFSMSAAAAPITSSVAAALVPVVSDISAYTTPIAIPYAQSAISASQRFHAYVAPSVAGASASCSPVLAYIGVYTMPTIGGASSGFSECVADAAGEFVKPSWLWINSQIIAPTGAATQSLVVPALARAAQETQPLVMSVHSDVRPIVASTQHALRAAHKMKESASSWEVGLHQKHSRYKQLRRRVLSKRRDPAAGDWCDIIDEAEVREVQEFSIEIRESVESS